MSIGITHIPPIPGSPLAAVFPYETYGCNKEKWTCYRCNLKTFVAHGGRFIASAHAEQFLLPDGTKTYYDNMVAWMKYDKPSEENYGDFSAESW